MPMPFLGKNLLYWCKYCNIPILEKSKCGKCNSETEKVPITAPYDIRPAFKIDIKLIRQVIDNQFGEGIGQKIIEENKIILLNKVPYFDRMDEIIIDGKIIGTIRYNISKNDNQWEFIPRIEGAKRIIKYGGGKWIKVDKGAEKYIRKAANVLAPGVISYDPKIEEDEYIIIINPEKEVIGIGIAKCSGEYISKIKRGMVAKTKRGLSDSKLEILHSGQTWNLVIEANKKVIENMIKTALNLINNVQKNYALPKSVSFSGGKDSICTLMLVLESGIKFKVFYIDTGIEFKETSEYVNEIMNDSGLKDSFIEVKSNIDFFKEIQKYQTPAKDDRWCNKLLKLNPVKKMIQEKFPEGLITFVGSRKYESFSRYHTSFKGKIVKNKLIPGQINVNLISNWTALHVWLFIFLKKIKFNPLYEMGYERIGCMYCPANKLADLEMLKEIHPELYQKWMRTLQKQAEKFNYPPNWIKKGFWRYRNEEKWKIDLKVIRKYE
ncbi:MAG: phosphoadenosine phosphosulfate reductase domain-containing protein [Candidatus Helarchaeota archaeon]